MALSFQKQGATEDSKGIYIYYAHFVRSIRRVPSHYLIIPTFRQFPNTGDLMKIPESR